MGLRFWLLSAAWAAVVIGSGPFLLELFDDAGIGLQVPGLSVTISEIAVIGLAVVLIPAVAALATRRS